MKILAITKFPPGITIEKLLPHQVEEVSGVWELYSGNLIREMYSRADKPGAVLILECASVEEAKEVLDKLPLVKSSLLDFEIIPLGPFHSLERLFSKSLDTMSAK